MKATTWAKPAVLRGLGSGHGLVEAAAGTGKTFTLEHLVVDQVLDHQVPIEQVLVVTFTRKAAAELSGRIRGRLVELRDTSNGRPGTPAWVLDDAARRRLDLAVRDFDLAQISTIHSFCQQVLRENQLLAGRTPAASSVEGPLLDEAFRRCVREQFTVDPALQPLFAALLERGHTTSELLEILEAAHRARVPLLPAVTPTAIGTARRQLQKAFSAGSPAAFEAEFSGLGVSRAKVQRCHAAMTEMLGDVASRPDWAFQLAFLGWLSAEPATGVDYYRKTYARAGPLCRKLLSAIEAAHAACPSLPALVVHALLPPVQALMAEERRRTGQLDHDALLDAVWEALERDTTGALALRLRQRYRVALVDEFQDTDETQWRIFQRLFVGAGSGHRLIAVGDPRQSIYRFRGGDVFTYLRARALLSGPGRHVADLLDNWRSSPGYVAAINALCGQGAPFFGSSGTPYKAVTAANPTLALSEPGAANKRPLHLLQLQGSVRSSFQLRRRFLEAIVEELAALLDGRHHWTHAVDGQPRQLPVGPSDVLVLTFTNQEARDVAGMLHDRGIPHALYREEGLLSGPEAKDLRDVLAALASPSDAGLRRKAWLTPLVGISFEELGHADALPADHPVHARLARWSELAERRRWPELFNSLLRDSGLARRMLFLPGRERGLANHQALLELLRAEVDAGADSTRELVEALDRWAEEPEAVQDEDANIHRLPTTREAVRVLTIHKAKGLEAPFVFLYGGFNAGGGGGHVHVFHDAQGTRLGHVGPLEGEVRAAVDREEAEELRRLHYVALTRARFRTWLPFFGPGFESRRRPNGPYMPLADRVASHLLEVPGFAAHCKVVPVDAEAPAAATPRSKRWTPPALHKRLAAHEEAAAKLAGLRAPRGGWVMTSFSAMSGKVDPGPALPATVQGARPTEDQLPAGKGTGNLVHHLLETLPVARWEPGLSRAAWRKQPHIRDFFEERWKRISLSEPQRRDAERMVYDAFSTPVQLPGGGRLQGLGGVQSFFPEVEFRLPFPEPAFLLTVKRQPGRWVVERGLVKGFVDFAFQDEDGRLYFGDWKTNVLADYGPAAVEANVRAHYWEQVRLYTLALARSAGLMSREAYETRFGGFVYAYVRRLSEHSGLFAGKVDWEELCDFEAKLSRWDGAPRAEELSVPQTSDGTADEPDETPEVPE